MMPDDEERFELEAGELEVLDNRVEQLHDDDDEEQPVDDVGDPHGERLTRGQKVVTVVVEHQNSGDHENSRHGQAGPCGRYRRSPTPSGPDRSTTGNWQP